jgi:hypothetical protein
MFTTLTLNFFRKSNNIVYIDSEVVTTLIMTDDYINSHNPANLNLPPWVWPGTSRPPIDSQAPTYGHLVPPQAHLYLIGATWFKNSILLIWIRFR